MGGLTHQQDPIDVVQLFCNLRTSLLAMSTPLEINTKQEESSTSKASSQKKEIEMVESILKKNEEERQIIQNHVCIFDHRLRIVL